MATYFVPYSGNKPAAVLVNGHRLVILSRDKQVFENDLGRVGADELRPIRAGDSPATEKIVLGKLASKVNGGVVIAPANVELKDILRNLEQELPWLH